jgi:hypothetical protein
LDNLNDKQDEQAKAFVYLKEEDDFQKHLEDDGDLQKYQQGKSPEANRFAI